MPFSCSTQTTTTTTHTKTLLGCPVAGEELQCAFIEEICGKTVEEILEIGRTDPEYEHTPLFLYVAFDVGMCALLVQTQALVEGSCL